MSATNPHEPDIQSLCCETLWSIETLGDKNKEWLRTYFEFCTDIFKGLAEKDAPGCSSASREPEIRSAIRKLRSHPNTTKKALRAFIREDLGNRDSTNAQIDKNIAFAVKLMLMVNCFHPGQDAAKALEEGRARAFWMEQNTFTAFIDGTLFHSSSTQADRDNHPLGHHHHPGYSQAVLKLRAPNLKKALGVSFVPTNNLVEHLKYDEPRGKVYVFHHAGFLKHQLELTKGLPLDKGPEESISL